MVIDQLAQDLADLRKPTKPVKSLEDRNAE